MWVQSLGREDPRRRKWQPTPIFLPGESHGQRSLVGYSPWGHKESDKRAHTRKYSGITVLSCFLKYSSELSGYLSYLGISIF